MIARRLAKQIAAIAVAASTLISAACSSSTGVDGGRRAARTTLPRTLTAAERASANSANAFSLALWSQLNKLQSDTNIFVSPLSASFALGMAVNGANGATLDEMRTALQASGMTVADMNAGYKGLIGLLVGLDPSVTMQIANSIWYRSTFTFLPSFVDADRTWFDATVSPLDFDNRSAALAAINGWVNDKTHGKITDIISDIRPADEAFLINAIYFKGGWRDKFDPKLTRTETFHGARGDVQTSFMHRAADMSYAETPAYQAVDLPYGDSVFTMTIVLPKSGTTIDQLASSFATTWPSLPSHLVSGNVDLALPKFSVAWDHVLNPDLEAMGMTTAFTELADFSKMTTNPVQISYVRQKAFVAVDEEGTEAAAATSVGIVDTAAPLYTTVRVDWPFLLVIRERLTGTLLFMGKIVGLP